MQSARMADESSRIGLPVHEIVPACELEGSSMPFPVQEYTHPFFHMTDHKHLVPKSCSNLPLAPGSLETTDEREIGSRTECQSHRIYPDLRCYLLNNGRNSQSLFFDYTRNSTSKPKLQKGLSQSISVVHARTTARTCGQLPPEIHKGQQAFELCHKNVNLSGRHDRFVIHQ